ncbi:MAG: bifunctional methylenetetrahydrofolate dehydrogenase/methenyltetrahydrofolate cyclohydrolase FolD [Endozoicomonadaceae bacterium]|nr:bifunctional methylenetetrahydrofolate dehydrogenase/methenyltetrahydrofolate cyclohydrolase FolD [Endozoicomonadaceae bacterium]
MTAKKLDGKKIALKIKDTVKHKVHKRKVAGKSIPSLAVILVSNDPASKSYVSAKRRACEYAGLQSCVHDLPETVSNDDLIALIDELNNNRNVNGILVQLPLPVHINREKVLEYIAPEKDVDGFHPYNLGKLCQRKPVLRPCTPKGIMYLLYETGCELRGKDAIIVGASEIVGRPMAMELLIAGCTVTVAHRFTQNLAKKVAAADIVIVATGVTKLVKGEWIKSDAIVIDVGITRMQDGTLAGDVEYDEAKKRAAWITPVPGGVGPMTVACLLENTLEAIILQENAG